MLSGITGKNSRASKGLPVQMLIFFLCVLIVCFGIFAHTKLIQRTWFQWFGEYAVSVYYDNQNADSNVEFGRADVYLEIYKGRWNMFFDIPCYRQRIANQVENNEMLNEWDVPEMDDYSFVLKNNARQTRYRHFCR